MNLATKYLGFALPHPLVVGAGPLTDDPDSVKVLEDHGAAALVLRSLYEEDVAREQMAAGNAPKSKDPAAEYYLGVMAANDGRLGDAAELLERAVRTDGSDRAVYALAAVHSLQGNKAGAVQQLQRAISMNPSNRTLALNDPDFDGLRDDAEFMSLLGKSPEGGA